MPNNVSTKYYLYNQGGESGSYPIYFRITYNRKKAELHTGFSCPIKDWNSQDQMTRSNHGINQELLNRKAKVFEYFLELKKNHKPVSATILKDLLSGKSKVQTFLLKYLENYIGELEIKKEIKPISLNKYKQSLTTLKEFILIKYKNPDIALEHLNFEFINAYDLNLRQNYRLHKNTINKYHSRLRTLLLRAHGEGIIQKQPYVNFKLINQKTERDFLSQEDLDKITELDLSHNKSLEKVKDIFVFSCYTGLRFQDAQNLTIQNLTKLKNKTLLRYIQEKTGGAVDIPLLPIAKRIIEKYKDEPERKIFNKLLPKISNQKLNSYLKIIADQAGISRKLTHHMARHTFATTICLNNGMPLEDVSKLLGHTSLKTTQIYGRITQQRLIKSMDKIKSKF